MYIKSHAFVNEMSWIDFWMKACVITYIFWNTQMNEENVEKKLNKINEQLDIISNARVKHHKIYMPVSIYTERKRD